MAHFQTFSEAIQNELRPFIVAPKTQNNNAQKMMFQMFQQHFIQYKIIKLIYKADLIDRSYIVDIQKLFFLSHKKDALLFEVASEPSLF